MRHFSPLTPYLAACRALGWVRVGPARGCRLGAKRSRVAHPASICNNACAPLQAQPEGPWRFAAPCVVAGSLCGLATRRRRRLAWHRDSPRRGPNPKSDRLLVGVMGIAAMFWTREVARDVPGRKRAVQPICSRIGRRGSRPSCATQSRVALRNRSLAFDAWPHDWEARACLPSSW